MKPKATIRIEIECEDEAKLKEFTQAIGLLAAQSLVAKSFDVELLEEGPSVTVYAKYENHPN